MLKTIFQKKFVFIYVTIVLADLAAINYYPELRVLTKPLIMSSLIAYYFINSRKRNHLFIIALFAALAGDIFLLRDGLAPFALGLSSFLIMQCLYAYHFFVDRDNSNSMKNLSIILLSLYGLGLIYYLVPRVEVFLKLPVIIYGISITIMAITAVMRKPSLTGYHAIWIGSLFFVVSDTFLAIDKFALSFYLAGLLVMSTYAIAQYFIVTGITEEHNSK